MRNQGQRLLLTGALLKENCVRGRKEGDAFSLSFSAFLLGGWVDERKNETRKLFPFTQHRKYCLWISITRNRAQALVSPLLMSAFI